jgi:2-C-methyl-D-erythritol 4-phosphate cytidylyltransferase
MKPIVMKTQAIIVAAGQGTRFKTKIPKSLVLLRGKPIFVHTLGVFAKSSLIDKIVLVAHPKYLSEFKNHVASFLGFHKIEIVPGGATRADSVARGLTKVDADTRIVVVHDGARPLLSKAILEGTIRQISFRCPAVTVGVPMKQTVKKVARRSLNVRETLNRDELWEIQTPQAFRLDVLRRAHRQHYQKTFTDDAVMVEALGIRVKVFEGDYRNIKITTQEDLLIAEAFFAEGAPPAS